MMGNRYSDSPSEIYDLNVYVTETTTGTFQISAIGISYIGDGLAGIKCLVEKSNLDQVWVYISTNNSKVAYLKTNTEIPAYSTIYVGAYSCYLERPWTQFGSPLRTKEVQFINVQPSSITATVAIMYAAEEGLSDMGPSWSSRTYVTSGEDGRTWHPALKLCDKFKVKFENNHGGENMVILKFAVEGRILRDVIHGQYGKMTDPSNITTSMEGELPLGRWSQL